MTAGGGVLGGVLGGVVGDVVGGVTQEEEVSSQLHIQVGRRRHRVGGRGRGAKCDSIEWRAKLSGSEC